MQDDGDTPAERLRRQQKALAEFGLLAFRSGDLDEILHRAAELVGEGLDVRHTKVLELLPDGHELLVRAGVGWHPGVVGSVRFGADGDSPAGFALSHDEPVISPDVDHENRFRIPQVLVDHGIKSMVNVIVVGEQGPFGVLEVDSERHRQFDDDDIAFLSNCANLLAAAVERHRAHASLERAKRDQDLLAQELAHRVKNLLGLVYALATQTRADHPEARRYREAFAGRLQALARAEDVIFEQAGQSLDLKSLVARSLEPFGGGENRKVVIDGPGLRVPARAGRMLGLALYELGTNSIKYGALSAPGGAVRITWAVDKTADGARVDLRWIETGGPAVEAPTRKGFGTRLLTTLIGYELSGEAELDHPAEGLRYRLSFAVDE